jgi:hypothetical protein
MEMQKAEVRISDSAAQRHYGQTLHAVSYSEFTHSFSTGGPASGKAL